MLYNNLSEYFRTKYGRRLSKICIDGGFSCPNRDGVCGEGGCIYCGERGAGEHIDPASSIREQVETALSRAKPEERFVAYFQNFTNTYAPTEVLRERYDAALTDERIVALAIGTRPDCLDEEKVRLIAEYKKRLDVWVELGLQTADDRTADIINRGYHREAFEKAAELLAEYGIPMVVHLIVGLPGESTEHVRATCEYVNRFNVWGLKIHSIYVMRGTRLARMYSDGEYTPPTLSEYIESAVYLLSHVAPDVVIHRLTGDCPPGMLIAPDWNKDKHKVINGIVKEMERRGLRQGSLYGK